MRSGEIPIGATDRHIAPDHGPSPCPVPAGCEILQAMPYVLWRRFLECMFQQQRRQSSHHTARLRRTIVGEGLGFNALNHRHTSLHDAREHLDPKLFPHFTPRITINPHINGKNQQMLRLIFPTLNEWHQINYRNSSLLRYVALALVGFRRSLGVHWSA